MTAPAQEFHNMIRDLAGAGGVYVTVHISHSQDKVLSFQSFGEITFVNFTTNVVMVDGYQKTKNYRFREEKWQSSCYGLGRLPSHDFVQSFPICAFRLLESLSCNAKVIHLTFEPNKPVAIEAVAHRGLYMISTIDPIDISSHHHCISSSPWLETHVKRKYHQQPAEMQGASLSTVGIPLQSINTETTATRTSTTTTMITKRRKT